MLINPRDVEVVGEAIRTAYTRRFGSPCDVSVLTPSDGATTLVD